MTKKDDKIIGERLERFREIRGLTQAVVAQRLGISSEKLKEVEAGRQRLRKEWLESLREAFGLDPAWLLGGKGPEDL
jgi:transcriptional regulator with XRE-family HTH domain